MNKTKNKPTGSVISPRLRESMLFSATRPKSVCTCKHTGDGAGSQHAGFGGHGACQATPLDGRNECLCGQFSWAGWAPEYREFMAARGYVTG